MKERTVWKIVAIVCIILVLVWIGSTIYTTGYDDGYRDAIEHNVRLAIN